MQVACARNDPDRLMECCSRARYCFSLTSSRLRIGSIVCKRLRFPLRAARLLFVTRTQGVRRLCGENALSQAFGPRKRVLPHWRLLCGGMR
jgi:hypothetical protein